MSERPGAYVDHERTACLCGDGLPGFWAAVCVTATGDDVLWLVSLDELDAEHPRCGNGDQPHEQVGPLPERWRERVAWSAAFRCGRPTKSGRPCRLPVDQAGGSCSFHRAASPDAERQTAS
ncbi:hypothetical protein [Mycobacterium marinum]|uniref:hypothetical protein n=1 Tax=Mycobacterium marinum TaxID=1781 RepID=UPI001920A3DA|nr:hypothetical protein [Mycobacterium marinum]QQW36879.1 hypothetical protein HXW97_25930 [Mycobacterium marinum]